MKIINALRLIQDRWLPILLNLYTIKRWPGELLRYGLDWRRYQRLPGAGKLRFSNAWPCLFERTEKTRIDAHYFYQALWATRRIAADGPGGHIDIGSDYRWVGMLTTHVPVTFVDLRPLDASAPGLQSRSGDILQLPFDDRSVTSLSCLHVVEHVGLGRYGDTLDPAGTEKACRELARVLAPGGRLYLSLPVGRPKVCFNAHRILSPAAVPNLCGGLELVEFSVVNDAGQLIENAGPAGYADARYACGLYVFTRSGV